MRHAASLAGLPSRLAVPARFSPAAAEPIDLDVAYIRELPGVCLLTTVRTGSSVLAQMGLLDGQAATNRKNPDRLEKTGLSKLPIELLAGIPPSCRISHARIVDSGRIITAGGIASGMELGLYRLRRAGLNWELVEEVAYVMEYEKGYAVYKDDIEIIAPQPQARRVLQRACA